jgi:signal transduction histidine kinase
VKYCGDDKTVIINLTQNNGSIRCEVLDHGMGISKEEVDNIWDRYYKASTNHVRTTTGTGLGLAIVKEIIKQHSGKYGVESQPGKGSRFWFELKK